MALALAIADIKTQMKGLVFPGFVTTTGWHRLTDVIRYLQAVSRRLEKLPADPQSDRLHMLKVGQVQLAWQRWLNTLSADQQDDEAVVKIRWMIEELRVSYFAQQLGTPYPVSEKRIQQAMKSALA